MSKNLKRFLELSDKLAKVHSDIEIDAIIAEMNNIALTDADMVALEPHFEAAAEEMDEEDELD